MTHKELKKILRNNGIGGMFGTGIRIFDTGFAEATFDDMVSRVNSGMRSLRARGYNPAFDYSESIADCDSASRWLQAEVSFQWYLENKTGLSYPFGFAVLPGHAINVGVTTSGLVYFNYGEIIGTPDKIIEVEFY